MLIIFLSLVVLAITVFFLISGKPNLFIFRLIGRVFGEEGGEKIRSRKWEVKKTKNKKEV
jgi:hypothetical protein